MKTFKLRLLGVLATLSPRFFSKAIDVVIDDVEPGAAISDLKLMLEDADIRLAYFITGFSPVEAVEDAQFRVRRARAGCDPDVRFWLERRWLAVNRAASDAAAEYHYKNS